MERVNYRIEKEQFEKMVGMNHKDRYEYLKNEVLSMAIVCGYGFYGSSEPYEKNGEYFVPIEIGSSCD